MNIDPAAKIAKTRRAKALFLREFRLCGSVTRSAEKAGVHRRTVYMWMETDERFKKLFDDSLAESTDMLEEEARRRAVDGVVVPQFYKGDLISAAVVREYSDALLMFLLKARLPEKYREIRSHQLLGKDGQPVSPAGIGIVPVRLMSDEEIDAELLALAKKRHG